MRLFPIVTSALLCWGGTAVAQAETCVARVNHLEVVIDPETVVADAPAAAPTRRERLRDWPARRWNRALGRPPACDSLTTISFLATYLELRETEGYCLAEDPEAGYLLVPGARNYRGRCRVTACERVNMAREETLQAAGSIAGIVTGTGRAEDGPQSGLAGFAHSSGAMLLSGNATSLTSALGSAASSVVAALSAPAVATAAAVSVVAVGGAVYVCSG